MSDHRPAMIVVPFAGLANMKIGSSFGARLEQTWGNPSWWNLLVVLLWVVGMAFMLYGLRADKVTASRANHDWTHRLSRSSQSRPFRLSIRSERQAVLRLGDS